MAALIGITAQLRAVLASHVALQLMDRRCLRAPPNIEGNGLMGIAVEAADLKIEVFCIERVTERRRGLRRSRPGVASELVGFPARLPKLYRRPLTS
jgi:hypothetical protein